MLAASMTMEERFKGTKQFKKEIFEKVQLELNQFGLLIYNANGSSESGESTRFGSENERGNRGKAPRSTNTAKCC